MTYKKFTLRLTEKQLIQLDTRSKETGFLSTADYIRFILFTEKSFSEKIDSIYKKVVKYE